MSSYFMNFHNPNQYGGYGQAYPKVSSAEGPYPRKIMVAEFPRKIAVKWEGTEGPGPKNKVNEGPGGGGKYFTFEGPQKLIAKWEGTEGPGGPKNKIIEGPGGGGKYFTFEGPQKLIAKWEGTEGPGGPKNKIIEGPGGGKYFTFEGPRKIAYKSEGPEGPGIGRPPIAKTLQYPESPIYTPPGNYTNPSQPGFIWQFPSFGGNNGGFGSGFNNFGNNLWNQFSNFLGGFGW